MTPLELLAAWDAGEAPDRIAVRAVVKASLAELVAKAPGRAVEVRVPPHAATAG